MEPDWESGVPSYMFPVRNNTEDVPFSELFYWVPRGEPCALLCAVHAEVLDHTDKPYIGVWDSELLVK